MSKYNDMEIKLFIAESRNGNIGAREKIVVSNIPLIKFIAKKYTNKESFEDLIQIGCIGLIKAIDHYDFSFDVKFSTYAAPKIEGEIKRYFRDNRLIKVSRTIYEQGFKYFKYHKELTEQLGREATSKEIAEKMGITDEEAVLIKYSQINHQSIHKSFNNVDGDEFTLLDTLVDETDYYGDSVKKILLRNVIKQLNQRDQQLIELRYNQEKTQTETAKYLGVTQMHVSRLERKLIKKLRTKIA